MTLAGADWPGKAVGPPVHGRQSIRATPARPAASAAARREDRAAVLPGPRLRCALARR